MTVKAERTVSEKTVFRGRALRLDVIEIETASGGRSVREVVRHPGAAVILARRPDGMFILVRQYRKAIESELLEAVAGTLEPGEAPEACARRELAEETGYLAGRLVALGTAFPAPGYTQEELHFFLADGAEPAGAATPDADEALETETVSGEDLARMIREGAIRDAKTIVAWHLYRERAVGCDGMK